MNQAPDVGVGIVGTGFLAETRARCYGSAHGVRLEAVTSRTGDNASGYAARHGVNQVCDDLDQLLALDTVDVVDLCVPNALHRPMAVAAAEAGKHVICTKPLTAYVGQDLGDDASDEQIAGQERRRMLEVVLDDARAMRAAAHENGVQLMYGENWVYAPAIVRARSLLEASKSPLLEMRGWECHSGSHSLYAKTWRHTGGGALLRLGAHPIGAMLHLKRHEGVQRTGAPIRPIAVTAEVTDLSVIPAIDSDSCFIAQGWQDVENWGVAIIQFEDGSRGVAYGSDNLLGGMESRLELYTANCHLKCNLSPNDLLRAYAPDESVFGEEYIMEKLDTPAGWSTPIPSEDWSSGQFGMLQDFVSAVRDKRPAQSDGELGFDVTRVIYGAYVSASEGQRVELGE